LSNTHNDLTDHHYLTDGWPELKFLFKVDAMTIFDK